MRQSGNKGGNHGTALAFARAIEPLERRLLMAVQLADAMAYGPAAVPASMIAKPLVATPVAITVSGTAKWTDPNGGTHAIPMAYVEIRSSAQANTDPALATCQTDVNGNFSASLNFDTSTGATVFARIFARNPAADVKPDTGAGATTYFMNTSSGAVTAAGPVALIEKDGSNSVVTEESFSILGATLQSMAYATTLSSAAGSNAPSQLDVRYPSNTAVNGTASFFLPSTKQLFITQRRIADWDVIEHEYGHYVSDRSGILAVVGGAHSFQTASPKPNGPGLAWNEGFADWFSIAAQLNNPTPYAAGVPNAGDTSYNPVGPPAGTNPVYNLATGVGVGELDESSVASVLYHLAVGDQGIQVKDTTMFSDFVAAKANTSGGAYDSIAAAMSGANRSLLGHVLGLQNIAPVETAPANFSTVTTSNVPTFTWTDTGNSNDFIVQFYTSDYQTLLFQTSDLGNVKTYTPAPADWTKIFDGHSTVKWFVEGEDTTAPATPGGVPDQTYSGKTLDRYWSQAQSLNGPSIAIVLDVTGSMQPEINSVEAGLVQYISNLEASLLPGETPPTIDLVTFVDAPTTVISSNDLEAVKADIQAQSANGGGDLPEPSAVSLQYAAQDIAPGGTMLLITDAPSDAGSDLDGTIAQLRAKGVTVNADISGDSGYTDEPTGMALHTGPLASLAHSTTTTTSTSTTTASTRTIIPLDNSSQDDTNEPPQAPITDAGQTPADDVGNTPATATPLAVNGAVVHAVIGNQVQDATGATVTDTDDYFSFNLVAGTSYNIPVLTDGSNNVTATWYGTDGMTSVTSGTTTTADPEFGYLTLTYTPTVSGTYYLDINQPDAATGYTVQVSDNPLVGTDSSVVLWTTTANATGGEFLFKPGIVNNSSDPNVATDYQASIVNVMDSTFEPTVLSATPNSLPAGTTLDVTLTGRKTNWIQGYSSVAFSGAGLTVNSVTVNSPTSITVSVTVASSAPPNFSNVTVSTQLGATTESAVGSNALQVTAADTSATLLQVEPSTLARGVTENVKVIGTLTSWNSTSTLSLGPGVTVTGVTVVSATEIIATASVANDAAIGFRVATVTTTSTGAVDTLDMAITLTAAPVTAIATVASATPSQVALGAHVVIAIVGENTNFVAEETTADFGPGVTVDSVSVTDATHATVTLDVTGSAGPGFRNVVMTTGTESAVLLDGFLVSPSIPLVLTAPAPVTPMLPFEPVVYVPFVVTLAAAGTSAITVMYATTDGTALAGTDYVATTGTLTIPAGQTSGIINVPLIAQDVSQAAKSFTLTLSNPTGGAAIGTGTATGSIAAITLTTQTFSPKSPLTYIDSKGQKVKVTIGGAGAGIAYFANGSADPADLAVTGTTARSSLTVTGSVASPAPIGGFGIDGPLGSLTATGTTLIGSSAIAGQASKVSLGTNTIAGDLFQFNGGVAPVSFTAKSIDGLTVMSVVPIKSLTATSWASGALTAPAVVSLTDKGNLGITLNVAGAVGSINVSGQITGGTWTIGGNLKSLKATRGIDPGWIANVTGNVGSVSTSALAGSLTAGGAIKSVSVATNMTADIIAQSIGTLSVGGAVSSSQVRAGTTIKSVKVGSIANSDVFAGVSSAIGTLPTSAGELTDATGSILSFSTRVTNGFSNTNLSAATLGTVSIKGAASTGAGGAAAVHFTAFTLTQHGSKPVKFSTKKAGAVPTIAGTDFDLAVI